MTEEPKPHAVKSEEKPEAEKWHRYFAVEANNRAWRLTELAAITEEQRHEAFRTAYASAYHWFAVGTEHNRAHAELLIARVHVLMREPKPALRYATSSYLYFTGRASEKWELAFAHAAMADACALGGDPASHRQHYEQASSLGQQLNEEDRKIFLLTFNQVPRPQ